MKRIFGLILAALFFFGVFSLSVFAINPDKKCLDSLYKATHELVRQDFLYPFFDTQASNDFQCFEERSLESMANVVLMVKPTPMAPYYFGIFHVHFTNDGKLASAVSFLEPKWQLLEKSDEWRKPWCETIRLVYPDELVEQGCAKNGRFE